MHIAYYISGHGYGHAARQQAVIRQLSKHGVQVSVRSTAPMKFFDFPGVTRYPVQYDIGMVQKDSMTVDVPATLAWYADFLQRQPHVVQQEAAWIRENNVDVIAVDIVPVAFDIAEAAGVPSVMITHFTWDWVYGHYIADHPTYQPVIDAIRASYWKADLVLRVPFAHEFDMFQPERIEEAPLLINPVSSSRAAVRAEFNVPDDHHTALLSMGGFGWAGGDVSRLRDLSHWTFLVTPGAYEPVKHLPNVRLVPVERPNFHEMLAAADVVVGKLGGSTVSEVIGHRTAMIYPFRPHWREHGLLHDGMQRYCNSTQLDKDAFDAGAWVDYLDMLMARDYTWPHISTDGDRVIAARLMQMATENSGAMR